MVESFLVKIKISLARGKTTKNVCVSPYALEHPQISFEQVRGMLQKILEGPWRSFRVGKKNGKILSENTFCCRSPFARNCPKMTKSLVLRVPCVCNSVLSCKSWHACRILHLERSISSIHLLWVIFSITSVEGCWQGEMITPETVGTRKRKPAECHLDRLPGESHRCPRSYAG